MKKLSITEEQWTIAAILVGVVGVILFAMRKNLPLTHMYKQPDKAESSPSIVYDQQMYPHQMEKYVVDPVTAEPAHLPVRYPPRAGHEMSCLIEHGFTPLFRPRKDLFSWVDTPPSEAG